VNQLVTPVHPVYVKDGAIKLYDVHLLAQLTE